MVLEKLLRVIEQVLEHETKCLPLQKLFTGRISDERFNCHFVEWLLLLELVDYMHDLLRSCFPDLADLVVAQL